MAGGTGRVGMFGLGGSADDFANYWIRGVIAYFFLTVFGRWIAAFFAICLIGAIPLVIRDVIKDSNAHGRHLREDRIAADQIELITYGEGDFGPFRFTVHNKSQYVLSNITISCEDNYGHNQGEEMGYALLPAADGDRNAFVRPGDTVTLETTGYAGDRNCRVAGWEVRDR